MKVGLDNLSLQSGGKKIALLGDMLELGENEKSMHFSIGQYISKLNIDQLICYGNLAEEIEKGARSSGFKNSRSFFNNSGMSLSR